VAHLLIAEASLRRPSFKSNATTASSFSNGMFLRNGDEVGGFVVGNHFTFTLPAVTFAQTRRTNIL